MRDMDGNTENRQKIGTVTHYMVIARVAGRDYLTRVVAASLAGAEHEVLDVGYVGKGGKASVEACQAFGVKEVKTDYFAYNALDAEPIGLQTLKGIILDRNEAIRNAERAAVRIVEIEQAMEMLEAELEKARDLVRVV